MTNNLMPWIVLAAIVLASLAWKGYFKLPGTTPQARPPAPLVTTPINVPGNPLLGELNSQELGLLMAHAARREAEADIAAHIAKEATDRLKATFSAPFSPAAPASAPAPAATEAAK